MTIINYCDKNYIKLRVTNREFNCAINKLGVPQGSISGPTLFQKCQKCLFLQFFVIQNFISVCRIFKNLTMVLHDIKCLNFEKMQW